MNFRELATRHVERLRRSAIQCADPILHMKQILEAVCGWDSAELYRHWEELVPPAIDEKVEAFLRRRLQGEPFQYIVGHEWFWKSRFEVGPGVLIPRRETEHLVEAFLDHVPPGRQVRVVELGAGSGNIGISCLLERPEIHWDAFEASEEAYAFALRNAETLLSPTLRSRYELRRGDFFLMDQEGPWDWVVSNPPYVSTSEIPTLAREIQREPVKALDGGEDGMDVLRKLIQWSARELAPEGKILLEMGADQGQRVREEAQSCFPKVEVRSDLAGLSRVLLAQR